ncbi:MAG: GTP-binding protein [Bacillus sp. (in: Bacteria)]|nr:GTP-binding protein [Bacillus sp. (in: firmicutes)]
MSDFKQNNTIFKGSKKHHTPEELYTYQLETFMPKTPLKLVGDFGIDTYIYQSTHPISLERLEEFFSNLPDGTLRTKGRCYVPYNNEIHYISHIGPTIEVFSEEFVHYKKAAKEYLTEFLFIGDQLEPLDIKKRLDNCLLIDEIPNFKESLT